MLASKVKRLNFVFGTRPEAVKLAMPILLAKKENCFEVEIVSTGQHREMMTPILDFFGVQPDHDLDLMRPGQTLTEIMTAAMTNLRRVWNENRPDVVCIQGDTITCAAAAVAAFLERIPLAHVEAGLRTYDIGSPFPEEYSRRIVALSAQWNFSPTESARQNLLNEGVDPTRVWLTGNTGIDALFEVKRRIGAGASLPEATSKLLDEVDGARSTGKKFILLTMHRRESFGEAIREALQAVRELAQRPDVFVVFPVHRNPAVLAAVNEILGQEPSVRRVDPLDYISFVALMGKADLILTDSGGVQEEAPSMGVPVLVLRENTERSESVTAGTALLVGTDRKKILAEASSILTDSVRAAEMRARSNPYGDGQAARRLIDVLKTTLVQSI